MVRAEAVHPLWIATRATGIVALLLLTATLALGVVDRSRWSSARWPRFAIDHVHRSAALLAVVFVALHVATTVLDGFVPISWADAVLPFHAGYRAFFTGLGALAFDLLLALVLTSLLRERIGYRAWRAVHWAAYACWPVAFVHALGTGSDAGRPWMLAVAAICGGAVAAALLTRVNLARPPAGGRSRSDGPSGAGVRLAERAPR